MTSPMRRTGAGNAHYDTVHCWACPGHTFNAGKVCTRCLNAGIDPVPEELRRTTRPALLNQALKAARARLTPDEWARHLARLANQNEAVPC